MEEKEYLDIEAIEAMLQNQDKPALRQALLRLEGVDIAELLGQVEKDHLVLLYRLLPKV